MKKGKLGKQLRKLATRDAIEKRRNNKPVDPFAALMASTKRQTPQVSRHYLEYGDEEEQDYGF